MVRVHSGKEGKSGVTVIMSLFFIYFPSDFPWLIFLTFFRGWSGFLLQLLKLLKPEYLERNCFASLHFSLFISIVCLVWITWCISPTNNFFLLIWGGVSWGISCIICRLVIRMFVLTFPHPFPIVFKKKHQWLSPYVLHNLQGNWYIVKSISIFCFRSRSMMVFWIKSSRRFSK